MDCTPVYFTIKQLVYSVTNTTVVYGFWYLNMATCFGLRPSSGHRTYVKDTIIVYFVQWDPILLTRCTWKQLRIYIYIYIFFFVKFKMGCSISKNKYEYY